MIRPADLRVIFMGTPAFAVPTLRALLDLGCDVRAVVSQPDKPQGRGQRVEATPVAAEARERGLTLFQWPRLGNDSYDALRALEPDVCVVVAYGRILPRRYLDLPTHGCLNVHASLLPRWRGAAPIQWAVIEGDARTGVAIMRMEEGLDTGPVARMVETGIGPDETAGELHDRLAPLGAAALAETIGDLCRAGRLELTPQPEAGVTFARRLEKTDGRLDWSWPARRVHDRVRGTSPWPGAYVERPEGPLKVLRTRLAEAPGASRGDGGPPGTVLAHDPDGPRVACGDGAVTLLSLQRPGRRVQPGADFLRGAADLVPGASL